MRTNSAMMGILLAGLSAGVAAADFTWRGQLADGGEPAEGRYDLSVVVYADEAGETVLGGLIEFSAISVSDGEFAVTLPLDEAIDLDRVWLEVGVRDADDPGGFETLAQRQRVELQPAAVCPAAWEISGNAGLGPGNFLGTTDATALELRADNRRALRIEPKRQSLIYGDTPNLILGSSANAVIGTGIDGATISGGGATRIIGAPCSGTCGNRASSDFASIGGGIGNIAGLSATVGGGEFNAASGELSAVGGGGSNRARGREATIPGGFDNVAGGDYSFAAGRGARIRDASESGDVDGDEGTFVWSDVTGSFSSSGPNQFLIRAAGGFALNDTPVHPDVEMTIRPDADGPNFANLFLGQRGTNAGILWTAANATGSSNNAGLYIAQYNGSAQTLRLTLDTNGDLIVTAAAIKPGGGSWSSSSDVRLKKNITDLGGALNRLLALQGISFEYADPDPALRPEGRHMGFIAQQVQPLFPHWIGQDPEGYLTVGPQGFEALAVEALRELRGEKDREIAALVDKLEANEALTAELLAQLDAFRVQQQHLVTRLDALDERPPAPPEQRIAGAGSR